MSRSSLSSLLIYRIVVDIIMIVLAWVLAFCIRFYSFLPVPKGIPEAHLYLKLIPFIIIISLAVFSGLGIYKRTGKHRSAIFEAIDLIQACLVALVSFFAFTALYEEYRFSRITLVIFAVLNPLMLILGRSLVRKVLRFYSRSLPPRQVLLIGGGDILENAVDMCRITSLGQSKIAGLISQGNSAEKKKAIKMAELLNVPIFDLPADAESWVDFFNKHAFHSVVIAVPLHSYTEFEQHLAWIASQIPDIKLVPDIVRYTRFAAGFELINGVPMLNIHDSPLKGGGVVLKRLMDVAGSFFGLLILSPLLSLLAVLVKLSSNGPVFYKQERMGLDGERFLIYKFRSMPLDSETKTGAVWATKGDNRATAIGSFMRRTSLDELPQLFNVLKGEMSLVGPRPERPVFVAQFRKEIPDYMLRHKTKAGITGWAQINGWRGDTSLIKRIEFDLYYIQNWSLWLDVKILLLTLIKGFINKNAY